MNSSLKLLIKINIIISTIYLCDYLLHFLFFKITNSKGPQEILLIGDIEITDNNNILLTGTKH